MRYPTLALLLLLGSTAAQAESFPAFPAAYRDACASCHIAFPPELLDADGWRRVMDGLAQHFGVDASPDAETRTAITSYLMLHAGRGQALLSADGQPRLSSTPWFRFEHGATPPEGVAFADCAACHTRAGQGDYGEDSLKIPRGLRAPEGD